ncbi:MAG: hypothetical protein GY820_40045, partial [Gammaproteobacteria bacterium]|nr:hypothetical protein [Gammaproteobacteria bacterium]
MRLVWKDDSGQYHPVTQIAPTGIKSADNGTDPVTGKPYPSEVYVMAFLPGGAGAEVTADLWSLETGGALKVPWIVDSNFKSYIRDLPLKRKSADMKSSDFNVYLSDPVTVTIKADETAAGHKLISGHWVSANLSKEVSKVLTYLSEEDCETVFDKKPSVSADIVDRADNFIEGKTEKPNSPANNPSMYSGVFTHSGEFVTGDVDLSLPGRGFSFVFSRTYRSQAIYSGVLGWGWDHSYNRRLVELPAGDIIYFGGSGRRERYKAIKSNGAITGYTAPKGHFTQLKKLMDGTFRIIYPGRNVVFFDASGKLIKIQDRNHNKMLFYYDFEGRLSGIMDTMGRMYSFDYYP